MSALGAAARVPLSVLELSPVAEGRTAADALAESLELVAVAERAGYLRLWFAEHHLNPGVVSTSPAVLTALAAERTERIRLGSGAVLLGHSSPGLAVEQFATIAQLHPGRIDLGLGRANVPPPAARGSEGTRAPAAPAPAPAPAPVEDRVVDGLLVPAPPPFTFTDPAFLTRFVRRIDVIGTRREIPDYLTELTLALELLGEGHPVPDGTNAPDVVASGVAAGADLQLWALASSPGESARAAGALGLPLAANYHVSPSGVLETVAAYREAFRPGVLAEPWVAVSADVLVAATDARAETLARGFARWVLGIRSATGAIPYPAPEHPEPALDERERALVADRVRTRFVGDPRRVVDGLERLVAATGADEVIVTTIAHDAEARLESFRLLARAWGTPASDDEGADVSSAGADLAAEQIVPPAAREPVAAR
ncbi:LLM class flavin-dependent oxidoreductase [Serinibacter arcticus]|uniref:Luciferase-like monooxygenase n=1 Tax=Serinibacter arcticus TaxID=1655435 RepID=A0A4Z1EBG1_9MICO|nr:LLM class flavin-dependent oxidoreductase [Serinibacter arcticus]TGO06751.1 Luciferase-like monooxygenase [Serinibacter arcticus]